MAAGPSQPYPDDETVLALRDAAAELAAAAGAEDVVEALDRAVARLTGGSAHEVRIRLPEDDALPAARRAGHGDTALVPIEAHTPGTGPVGILLVDPATAALARLRPALEGLSAQAAAAMDRIRLTAEVSRIRSSREVEALLEQTCDVVLIVGEDDRVRYASPQARNVFGTSALREVSLLDFIDARQRAAAEFLLRHVRSGAVGAGDSRADWTIRSLDGRAPVVEVSCRELHPGDPARDVALTLHDVTAQRRLEHELTERMFHDTLTGLPNRALFAERTEHAVAAGDGLAAVLLIDLNDFGSVNDGYGHAVGDEVLSTVGRRVRRAVGEHGFAARYGGDQFAALIRDAASAADVEHLAARICRALSEPVRTSGGTVVVCSASVGVATTLRAANAQELLRNANLALRAAKSAGTGQWLRYEPSMSDQTHQAELRTSLGRAIAEQALFLEYQPIVALGTGRTVGFEALLRWRHPGRGRLLPGEFIEIAEESRLILPIGEWVLEAAMRAAQRWRAAAQERAPYVSVNVSAHQFRSEGFADSVARLLDLTGLPAHRLVLEITESSLLRDDDKVWHALERLRGGGVRIAIDDFGTGYSALGYLRQVPLDIVKLDRLFVRGLTTSRRQRDLVEGIVTLTRALSLDIVAEGIETEHQRRTADAAGCTYGQGYLFAAPLPEDQTLRWLDGEQPAPPA
ncbi:putative bifunctional diguanylate cyclase/phosphodiesterase [Catellatospora bangladeshensis]|uniref:Two-component system response regulator n=1 Tax=Catellatospora bangladeshensis TaxID=310355 RepID=A0A8J3NLA4_9ACTN|nr:EAL domain-containing protein [Catellatospora bangladeshensis]GIF82310.1 two-component system response regulator [Catellatospora bangladeshensis]